MDDPRQLPVPDDPVERLFAFARDLAYGVIRGEYSPEFLAIDDFGEESWAGYGNRQQEGNFIQLMEKWSIPGLLASTLELFGLVRLTEVTEKGSRKYMLTSKAMSLLERPAQTPTVFICYRRQQSSAFALLLESRLRERGVHAFLDRLLEGGAEWEALIKDTIYNKVSHLICVIGPDSLHSPNVRNEIHWATEANKIMIPIWHNGFTAAADQVPVDSVVQEFVNRKNAIRVLEESALAYDNAINQLLNQLEFAVIPTVNWMGVDA